MKNYGLDLLKEAAEVSLKDWEFFASAPLKGLAENIDTAKYLPVGEIQRGREDFMDCATRDKVNSLEAKFTYLYQTRQLDLDNIKWLEDNDYIVDNRVVFSDRFIAILSGTTRQGNSMKAPLEAIKDYGLIPKTLLPAEKWMMWSDYHNKSKITQNLKDLGKEFLTRFKLNYERIYQADFPFIIKKDMICVAGFAWGRPTNGIYKRVSNSPNHAFLYFKKPAYMIFDNYIDSYDGDFIKQLASDYWLYPYGYRAIVNEVAKKKIMIPLKREENSKKVFAIVDGVKYWINDWKNLGNFYKMFGYPSLKEAQDAVEEVGENHLNQFPNAGVIGNPSIIDFLFGRNK